MRNGSFNGEWVDDWIRTAITSNGQRCWWNESLNEWIVGVDDDIAGLGGFRKWRFCCGERTSHSLPRASSARYMEILEKICWKSSRPQFRIKNSYFISFHNFSFDNLFLELVFFLINSLIIKITIRSISIKCHLTMPCLFINIVNNVRWWYLQAIWIIVLISRKLTYKLR